MSPPPRRETFPFMAKDDPPLAQRIMLVTDAWTPQVNGVVRTLERLVEELRALGCEVEVVIKALHWAIDVWKCRIVNLSLGVAEQRLQQLPRRNQFLRAIEDAYFKDVLVVAAAHNDHPWTRSYPALFAPPLVSVDKQLFAEPTEFAYRPHDQIEFFAHGRGYLGPFANGPATSWAAPHLAGAAARLASLRPGLKPFELKTLLYWLSRR